MSTPDNKTLPDLFDLLDRSGRFLKQRQELYGDIPISGGTSHMKKQTMPQSDTVRTGTPKAAMPPVAAGKAAAVRTAVPTTAQPPTSATVSPFE